MNNLITEAKRLYSGIMSSIIKTIKSKLRKLINQITKVDVLEKKLEATNLQLENLNKEALKLSQFLVHSSKARYREDFNSADFWLSVNKDLHHGESCFILGNGPSLKQIKLETLSKLSTFGTNGIFLHHVPDYYVTISKDFYKHYIEEIRNFKCKRKFICSDLKEIITYEDNESLLNCSWPMYGSFLEYNFPTPLYFSKRV